MCDKCFTQGINCFASAHAFEEFDLALVKAGLILVERKQTSPAFSNSTELYTCPSCQEMWVLSPPDNAWRGYFLPAADAQQQQQKLRQRDRIKGFGGLVMLLFLALLLLAYLVGAYR